MAMAVGGGAGAGAGAALTAPRTLFDALGAEEMENIVAWAMRICPLHDEAFPHPYKLLFARAAPFVPVIRRMYRALTVVEGRCYEWTEAVKRADDCVLSPFMARCHDVCRCLGPAVDEVELDLSFDDVLQDVLHFCRELRALRLVVSLPDPSSNPVAVQAKAHVVRHLLAKHAHSLRELKVAHENADPTWMMLFSHAMPQLKSLALRGNADWVKEVRALRGVAEGLECFELVADDNFGRWKELFKAIQVNWTRLTNIRISGNNIPQDEYENLLVSYGPRLRRYFVKASESDFAVMCRVARGCPNLEFCVITESNVPMEEGSHAYRLAPHIAEISLEFIDGDAVNWEAFECFASRLTRLKKLTCITPCREALHALFSTPKPALESLDVRAPLSQLDDVVLGRMRNVCGELREFSLSIDEETTGVDEWCTFMASCPSLQHVVVVNDDGCLISFAKDICNRVLGALSACTKLQSISIEPAQFEHSTVDEMLSFFHNEVKNQITAAQFFRNLAVRVELFGFEMFVPPVNAPWR